MTILARTSAGPERENMRTFLDLVAEGRVSTYVACLTPVRHRARSRGRYDTLDKGDALGILIDYGTAPAAAAPEPAPVASRPRVRRRGAPGSASWAPAPSRAACCCPR
jgi:hypothetical protein